TEPDELLGRSRDRPLAVGRDERVVGAAQDKVVDRREQCDREVASGGTSSRRPATIWGPSVSDLDTDGPQIAGSHLPKVGAARPEHRGGLDQLSNRQRRWLGVPGTAASSSLSSK